MRTRHTSPCAPGSECIPLFRDAFSGGLVLQMQSPSGGHREHSNETKLLVDIQSCHKQSRQRTFCREMCILLSVGFRNTTHEAPSGPLNAFEPRQPERSVYPGRPCNLKCLGLGYVRRVSGPGDAHKDTIDALPVILRALRDIYSLGMSGCWTVGLLGHWHTQRRAVVLGTLPPKRPAKV